VGQCVRHARSVPALLSLAQLHPREYLPGAASAGSAVAPGHRRRAGDLALAPATGTIAPDNAAAARAVRRPVCRGLCRLQRQPEEVAIAARSGASGVRAGARAGRVRTARLLGTSGKQRKKTGEPVTAGATVWCL